MTDLTPDEAHKETCPLIRYCVNQDAVMQYNAVPIHEHQPCQGPDCKIGWRWTDKPFRGYCGAFGRPE